MGIPLYGSNKDGINIQDVVDLFRTDKLDPVEGKGFLALKAEHSFLGGTSANSGVLINVGTDTSVWGGFVRVEGIGNDTGSLDFDLGLTAGASDFGAGYGSSGDGVYALKAHDFIDISTPEDVHLSIDANTIDSSKTIKVTICILTAVAPASS
jgi:hypothetical protein